MARLAAPFEGIKLGDAWRRVGMTGVLRYPPLLHFFRAVSWLGNGIFWYSLMLTLLVQRGNEAVPAVLHMAGGGGGCPRAFARLKRGTGRPGPSQGSPGTRPGAVPPCAYGFP